MKTFEDRLKLFAKYIGSASKLADKLGMSAPALQSYTNGRSKPGYQIIMKLHNMGCNINWLLSGEGNMILSDLPCGDSPPIQTNTSQQSINQEIEKLEIEIRLLKSKIEDRDRFIELLINGNFSKEANRFVDVAKRGCQGYSVVKG